MEKLTENMIRWAESKLGSTEYEERSHAALPGMALQPWTVYHACPAGV